MQNILGIQFFPNGKHRRRIPKLPWRLILNRSTAKRIWWWWCQIVNTVHINIIWPGSLDLMSPFLCLLLFSKLIHNSSVIHNCKMISTFSIVLEREAHLSLWHSRSETLILLGPSNIAFLRHISAPNSMYGSYTSHLLYLLHGKQWDALRVSSSIITIESAFKIPISPIS